MYWGDSNVWKFSFSQRYLRRFGLFYGPLTSINVYRIFIRTRFHFQHLHNEKQVHLFYILFTVHLDEILVNDQLDAPFFNVFISFLYMFRATRVRHQEDQLVSIHHLSDVPVKIFLLNGTSDSHPPVCFIPDYLLIQVGPPVAEHLLLETCRGMK
jgi:hypothetical protein